jgi:hypothetical protein
LMAQRRGRALVSYFALRNAITCGIEGRLLVRMQLGVEPTQTVSQF